jgi:hypothetical protein
MSSTGEQIASGFADFGRATSSIHFIIGCCFALICFGFAIYFFANADKNLITGTATVTENSSECKDTKDSKGNVTTMCTTRLSYSVDKPYTVTLQTNIRYNKGDSVEISYDSNKPDIATLKEFNKNVIGGILIGVGVLILLINYAIYKVTQTSEAFATAKGAEEGARLVANVFNGNH